MKKTFLNWMMAVALVATPMVFTACGDDDDDNNTRQEQGDGEQTDSIVAADVIIDFENAKLNDENYWIGDTTGVKSEAWGSSVWACSYVENGASVNTTYGGNYWTGFAISACTGTTFADGYMGADQYNCVVGKAYSGKNFLVAQNAYGENITFQTPVTIKEFYYTNAAVTVNSILNGDDMETKFEDTDWLKCTVNGLRADSTLVSYNIDLAKDGNYVNEWKAVSNPKDFTDIINLSFSFSGSRNGEYGLDTPAYICLDKFVVEPKN